MEILEFGNRENRTIILIHGFESPYQIWNDYIACYETSFHIVVPILTGHNVKETEDFTSFDSCAKELEDFCIARFGNRVYAVYGMSMGGVLACCLWKNKRLLIEKLILESTPLLSYGRLMTTVLTRQYLNLTHNAQQRDPKTVNQAIGSIVTKEQLPVFLALLDHMTDATIKNYIRAIGAFKLPANIDTPATQVYYYYGSKLSERIFRDVAKFIQKHYSNASVICLDGKGHCEDAILHPEQRMADLNQVLCP